VRGYAVGDLAESASTSGPPVEEEAAALDESTDTNPLKERIIRSPERKEEIGRVHIVLELSLFNLSSVPLSLALRTRAMARTSYSVLHGSEGTDSLREVASDCGRAKHIALNHLNHHRS